MRAPLALTAGEPAGIGPDLVALIARTRRARPWVFVGDPALLADRARRLDVPLELRAWTPGTPAVADAGVASVLAVPLVALPRCGAPDPANARAVLATLDRAVDGCIRGEVAALVTGPIQKSTINDAGIPFTGHTEHLAARAGGTPVMLLVAGTLRVALVTTHLPLRSVPDAVTGARNTRVVEILEHDLRTRFGIESPRIAVLGLNPHAGEGGHLGREELDVIAPALAALRARGVRCSGPLAADTAFTPAARAGYDAVLAMYHDQGLTALKTAGFGEAVNCTLGLPIVRTSVDHGTALALAGSGRIETGSMLAAIELAAVLTANRP